MPHWCNCDRLPRAWFTSQIACYDWRMESVPNSAETQEVIDAVAQKQKSEALLKYQQEQWIDYNAVGGLITHDDGTLEPMSIAVFASKLGVHRNTLTRWKKEIPNFWDLVKKRRHEIGTQTRTNKVWNGVYLRAARGDAEQAKIWLSTFDNWQPPAQKHEVQVGTGLADLVAQKRAQIERERNVIDATTSEDTTQTN